MVSGVGSTSGAGSANTGNAVASAVGSDSFVSQNTFLTLLITQLKNQDPMNPQDSSQFVAQLASFSSLEQMTQLNKNINTVLESSVTNLIGKTVTVADSKAASGFTTGAVTGIVYYADGPAVSVGGNNYALSAIQNVSQ